MSRWKAAAIHFSMSLAIGIVIACLLFGVWYPQPYFHAAGADSLMLLLVGVDLALGPLLTLVVFRVGKPGLRFDLIVIALVQSIALVYGMSVVLRSRPVFLVAAIDRFTLVAAQDVAAIDLANGDREQFRTLPWDGPRLVGAVLPTAVEERNDLVFSSVGGKDLPNLPKYYVEYAEVAKVIASNARPLESIPRRDPEARAVVDAAVRASEKPATALGWLPLVATRHDMVMLVDRDSGQPVQALAIDPWEA